MGIRLCAECLSDMKTAEEMDFFREHGYLHVPQVLDPGLLGDIRAAFDSASTVACRKRVWQESLLAIPAFINLLEHKPILDRLRAVFGDQLQVLSYDLLYQGPGSKFPEYGWHRDFVFPGDEPLAVNAIIYLDDMTEDRGPTVVVPGTHRGSRLPPKERLSQSLTGEVKAYAKAGDAVFINSAIWHSGGRNKTEGERRVIYLYCGYWWLKRDNQYAAIPWQALENASEARLQLLGIKAPREGDIWVYDQNAGKMCTDEVKIYPQEAG